ncbi:hypothetical protein BDK51DRAFT_50694 [Blyttiomyces helicus]|uniref:RanBD1 domain-containing protein n=1 Tax=Blyttiomyces helicus TaxID=388810 RepID=A0A4P9W274_9FUNG|nr:hypothetical protein BDK51DRAFT_50694 [Blyttiomyces helicus]|eukprot:RKO84690.1 hypothetical protein BDK51DRAFT_50694 [Blyttiomyces helicus]
MKPDATSPFGTSASTDAVPGAPSKFTFGSSSLFASAAASTSAFGFAAKSGASNFASLLKDTAKGDGESAADDGDEKDSATEKEVPFKKSTVEPLDAKDVLTGEEEETTVLSTKCKLFAWEKPEGATEGSWKERGKGLLRVNESKKDPKCARLGKHHRVKGSTHKSTTPHSHIPLFALSSVMRADGVFRLILNVRIVSGMPCKARDEKFVEILACEAPSQITKFLFKVANAAQGIMLVTTITSYSNPDPKPAETEKEITKEKSEEKGGEAKDEAESKKDEAKQGKAKDDMAKLEVKTDGSPQAGADKV